MHFCNHGTARSNLRAGSNQRIGHPSQKTLDLLSVEVHLVEKDAGPHSEGVRRPALEVFLVCDGVEVVDSRGNRPHVLLDLIRSEEATRPRVFWAINC